MGDYDRMVKISQGSTLSITNVTDIVSRYVRSVRGSVKDALHMLEESYGLLQEGNMLKRDCFFCQDYQDMGATVYTCDYHKQYGYCPCEECDKYVSKGTASNFIRDMVDSGNNPEHEKAKDLFAYLSIQVFQKAANETCNSLLGMNKAFNAMVEAARDLKAKSDENQKCEGGQE